MPIYRTLAPSRAGLTTRTVLSTPASASARWPASSARSAVVTSWFPRGLASAGNRGTRIQRRNQLAGRRAVARSSAYHAPLSRPSREIPKASRLPATAAGRSRRVSSVAISSAIPGPSRRSPHPIVPVSASDSEQDRQPKSP